LSVLRSAHGKTRRADEAASRLRAEYPELADELLSVSAARAPGD
jgi:hypothetical protein